MNRPKLGRNWIETALSAAKCKTTSVTAAVAAAILGKAPMFVYLGLRKGLLPFGYAVRSSEDARRWNYYISPKQFMEYTGISADDLAAAESAYKDKCREGWGKRGRRNPVPERLKP